MTRSKRQKPPASARRRISDAIEQLGETFVGRSDAIQVIVLAHLAAANYLLVGDPGTAKTAVARCFARHITDARFFATLLGSFTTPEKIFGALDIEAFKRGEYRHRTEGMLPEAHFAFLDEAMKCNDGAFNELLTAINEHEFGGAQIPLMTCGAATNWPELERRSDIVEALYDRFLLRCQVDDLSDEKELSKMLSKVDGAAGYEPRSTVTLEELIAAQAEVGAVKISKDIRNLLAQTRNRVSYRQVRGGEPEQQIKISSRRVGQLQRVLQAAAWLEDRDEVTVEDFDVLRFGLWVDRSDAEKVSSVLSTIDAEEVRRTVATIDKGREAAQQYRQTTSAGPSMLRDAMEEVRKAAAQARSLFERPVYTAKGRDEIRTAMRGLKDDFAELKQAAAGFGGGK